MLEMPDKKEFSNLYLSRATVFDLAEKYFVSVTTISRWIKIFGLIKTGTYLKKKDLQKLLKKKTTYTEMAKKLDCSLPTLKTYLKKYKLITCKFTRSIPLDMEEIYKLRVNSKWTFLELAELYQVSMTPIRKRCEKYNFPKVKVEQEARTWRRIGGKL